MMDGDGVTLEEVYQSYAGALNRDARTLTDAEKQQAFLNAVLAGQRVEPFATWNDIGDAVLNALAPGAKTLNQWAQEHCQGT